jgi:hypothetical protein
MAHSILEKQIKNMTLREDPKASLKKIGTTGLLPSCYTMNFGEARKTATRPSESLIQKFHGSQRYKFELHVQLSNFTVFINVNALFKSSLPLF